MPARLPDHRARRARAAPTDDFRDVAREAIGDGGDGETWERFAQRLAFSAFSAEEPEPLVEAVDAADEELGGDPRRLHYLSIPPGAFGDTVARARRLRAGRARAGRAGEAVRRRPRAARASSTTLVHGVFPEERVFRIDHFLGREAVQNLIALRFANGMFEPIWNRDHIDHVQIDVPETLAVDDRAGFYEDDRRLPRHGRHAPLPRARLRGHGAADDARGALDRRGDRQGVPVGLADRPGLRDPRPVRRLPRGRRRRRPTRRRRRSSPCAPASTTGAGPACRSSCARASAWASSGGC